MSIALNLARDVRYVLRVADTCLVHAQRLAEWCGLNWEPHFHSLTRAARAQRMDDTKVAFIAVLHGDAQGTVARGKEGTTCSDEERARVAARLLESEKAGIPKG